MIKVIIVDDDYSVRYGLANNIKWDKLGAEVILLASNGMEALKKLEETEADLIISDIKMPEMDGLELFRAIKAKGINVNFMLLSAYAEFEYAQEALLLGACEYIIKPINREKLRRIEKLVYRLSSEKRISENIMKSLCDAEFKENFVSAVISRDDKVIEKIIYIDEDFANLLLYKEYCTCLVNILDDSVIDKSNTLILLYAAASVKECYKLMIDMISKKTWDVADSKKTRLVESIIRYVNENYGDSNLNVQGIANHFNLSMKYVSAIFISENGGTLSDLITTCRITKAAELLMNTNFTIQEIALKVGYEDVRYFRRVFNKRMGINPTQCRNMAQQTEEE